MLVACPNQGQPHGGRPLADRQRSPVLGFGLRDQAIELILSLENRAKRQTRFNRERARTNQKDWNQHFPSLHMANNSTRNSSPINPESVRVGMMVADRSYAWMSVTTTSILISWNAS